VLYDAVEQVFTVLNTNFATDFAALLTQKGLTGLGLVTTANIVKRQDAEDFVRFRVTTPTIGILGLDSASRAKDQGKRDNRNIISVDYFATGSETDGPKVQKQVELAAEAIHKSVDRLHDGVGGGVFGASVEDNDLNTHLERGYSEGQTPLYLGLATVTFSVDDRDDQ
jgi:hypothetical protein